jgi:hypothetical protein
MRLMADRATRNATINTTPEVCLAVALDYERYPEWARDVKGAVVRERDDQGRATQVEFTAAAIGRSAHYTLAYDYSGLPEKMSWSLSQGDIVEAIDGAYTFSPSTTVPGATDVQYDLAIELGVPMPGFVKRRAEVRILNTLTELKERCESLPS